MSILPTAAKQEIPAFFSQDDSCPQCKSHRYLNSSMKLLVGPCYDKMCEGCVHRIFDAGPAPCPECGRILRKNEFYQQVFEDVTVENEVRIRARMATAYNKRQTDFKTLKDYNDYLEMVEDLTMKLLSGEDTDLIEEIIEKYKRENKALIESNLTKQQREEKIQRMILNQEKSKRQQMREEYLKQLAEEEREKTEAKNSLINALATSDKSAKEIIKTRTVQLKKSSLSNRNSNRRAQLEIEALLKSATEGLDDDDEEMAEDVDDGPFDPSESPYEPAKITLREKYDDPTPVFRQGNLAAAGVTREIHYRYLLEGAMAGLFELPLADKTDEASN
ncbi:TFIIH/NER complex subunit [Coemansia erecta]|uniref:RNA polymerase II transcription factor B subunit 3 n=1 Tax=Coemansia asiatica TaxID=1052880 RepID=A0A9W8CL60_9FUNG|nr:TFIIH/NER complex subunit [Coemansia asiatica]KAJ2855451.1 TFIIH/NER complex subunit [Coemansia erecta]KAJ2888532.1 TFIIH/NER complex subunit [Coemansia asiatica]